jgi:IS30 family transposase
MRKYARLSFEERVKIETYFWEGFSQSEIARKLERNKSTISRELWRFQSGYMAYRGERQARYFQRTRRRWQTKIDKNQRLKNEVYSCLRKRWSPEQISLYLKRTYTKDHTMQVSHETIYTYIYALSRGELKNELINLLRQKKKARKRVKRKSRKPTQKVLDMISIDERPKHVAQRCVPGDWEGDLLIGKNHGSALGTLVERKTRAVFLVRLGKGYSPSKVRRAFERTMKTIPEQMRVSLTYDRGIEMGEHKLFTKNTKMKVYFCDPASPWQRGTCENTNGLIRDYFPKGTDFSRISKKELERVQDQLNERPRKTLGFKTPKEVFNEEVLLLR